MHILKSKSGSTTTRICIKHCDGLTIEEDDMVGTKIDPNLLNRITLSEDAYIVSIPEPTKGETHNCKNRQIKKLNQIYSKLYKQNYIA